MPQHPAGDCFFFASFSTFSFFLMNIRAHSERCTIFTASIYEIHLGGGNTVFPLASTSCHLFYAWAFRIMLRGRRKNLLELRLILLLCSRFRRRFTVKLCCIMSSSCCLRGVFVLCTIFKGLQYIFVRKNKSMFMLPRRKKIYLEVFHLCLHICRYLQDAVYTAGSRKH